MVMTAVNNGLSWITKMAFLNILWLFFLLPGLIVFGFFPATAAMFAVIRKWLMGETDTAVFQTFWRTYKNEFVRSNKLGFLLAAAGYVLYLDFLFLTSASGNLVLYLTIPYFLITILFVLTGLYAFPMFVHYEMKTLKTIKSAFFMMAINPLPTITMVAGVMGIGFVLWRFQGLALFFSFSIMALVIMMPALRAFEKIQAKQGVSLQGN